MSIVVPVDGDNGVLFTEVVVIVNKFIHGFAHVAEIPKVVIGDFLVLITQI